MSNELVPNKNDGGAVMFWTYHNQLQEHLEKMDAFILELARSQHETKRRLAAIEHAVKTHGRIIYEDQATIKMFCIACHHEFDVPIAEADNPDFVTTCPECHNWSLPMQDKELNEYSPKTIARETGFAHSTVCQVIRELGLKNGRRLQLYGKEDFQKIAAVLKSKKPRRKYKRDARGSVS